MQVLPRKCSKRLFMLKSVNKQVNELRNKGNLDKKIDICILPESNEVCDDYLYSACFNFIFNKNKIIEDVNIPYIGLIFLENEREYEELWKLFSSGEIKKFINTVEERKLDPENKCRMDKICRL